jgi:hypothetical protein
MLDMPETEDALLCGRWLDIDLLAMPNLGFAMLSDRNTPES